MIEMEELMQCVWAFTGTFSFGLIFNLRGKNLMYASLGGLLAWVTYLVSKAAGAEEVMAYFIASVGISFYAEIMAIERKTPVTVFIMLGMIPLVPGGGIFYTMQGLITKNYEMFLQKGFITFASAGAIALGILIASFCVQTIRYFQRIFLGKYTGSIIDKAIQESGKKTNR